MTLLWTQSTAHMHIKAVRVAMRILSSADLPLIHGLTLYRCAVVSPLGIITHTHTESTGMSYRSLIPCSFPHEYLLRAPPNCWTSRNWSKPCTCIYSHFDAHSMFFLILLHARIVMKLHLNSMASDGTEEAIVNTRGTWGVRTWLIDLADIDQPKTAACAVVLLCNIKNTCFWKFTMHKNPFDQFMLSCSTNCGTGDYEILGSCK